MSVNLKGRKNAKSEQAAPAPELVMAGGQTPWGADAPPAGNPFAEAGAPAGMPTMPPPPPPFAPGEEAEAQADAPTGRKLPNPKIIAAVAAVVVLGGGYFYLNSGGSSTPAPAPHRIVPVHKTVGAAGTGATVGTGTAKAGTAKAGTAKGGTAKAGTAKGGVVAAKGGTATKTGTTGKGGTPATGTKAAATKPTAKVAAPVVAPGPAFTAALPGRIGEWSKQISLKVPDGLAKYDPSLGTSPKDIQKGDFGIGDDTYLTVEVADHSPNAKKTALEILKAGIPDLRSEGFVVAAPYAVSHAPYGGTAACTTLTVNDVLGVACVWMDNNTFGVILAPHRAQSNATSILGMVRGSVEH